MSDLTNLSWEDFEDLCLDIARAETGKRFNAFGPGADGGEDGRHSCGDDLTIIQCKHYIGSSFDALVAASKKEIVNLERLKPKRYLFFTSQLLSRSQWQKIRDIFGGYLLNDGDLWGQKDIDGALRNNPDILKSHFKLWLSGAPILEKILNSGFEEFTNASKMEILDELKVYVKNKSFDEAIERLEREKVLIVSGPPGVGKTTLAKMISYKYLGSDFSYHAIRSLDDGFKKIKGDKPIVFFFDDFLGKVELSKDSLLKQDSALAMFVKSIKRAKNFRFILTTRAHIFEEARLISDHVDHGQFQLAKYLLDVGVYTRRIKSSIFYQHLKVSDLSSEHFMALLDGDFLTRIIDHPNYNPRLISYVSSDLTETVVAGDYPLFILKILEKPDIVWEKPYRCLNIKSKSLLIVLYFSNQYGVLINDLKLAYDKVHRTICVLYNQPLGFNDFEDSLHSLESGFINIDSGKVNFLNPSVRDFLKSNLTDITLLYALTKDLPSPSWASELWNHILKYITFGGDEIEKAALKFLDFSRTMDTSFTRPISSKENTYQFYDLSFIRRVELLETWWYHTGELSFLQKVLDIFCSKSIILMSYEADDLPSFYKDISNSLESIEENIEYINLEEDPDKEIQLEGPLECARVMSELLKAIESRLLFAVNDNLDIEYKIRFKENFDLYMHPNRNDEIASHLDYQISQEFENVEGDINNFESSEELQQHLDFLRELSSISDFSCDEAELIISRRIDLIEEDVQEVKLEHSPEDTSEYDIDEVSIRSLFSNLISPI